MAFTVPGRDTMNLDVIKAVLESAQASKRNAPRMIGSGKGAVPMDQVLAVMPRRKLTRDDFLKSETKHFKEKADREASLPPEHVPLVNTSDLMGTLKATWDLMEKQTSMSVNQVVIQWPQKYSTAKMEDLSRIHVVDLMVRKTHKGSYLVCRTCSPAVYDGGIGFLLCVDDPKGDTVYLKLYNFVLLLEANQYEWDTILPIGTILLIREPSYYTNANVTDLPYIMVESPSDVILLESDNPIISDVSWKREGMKTIQPRATTGEAWKAEGLNDFKASRWFTSAVCFTACIKLGFEIEVSRLNRAEVYLRMGWNNSALHDAQAALDSGTLSDDMVRKAANRKIKALYALGRYQEVSQLASSFEGDKVMAEWITKANQRMEERTTGDYDWLKLYKGAEKKSFSPDIADYTGPVEVKNDSDGLRGTYLTREVKAGELLMFHKPSVRLSPSDKPRTSIPPSIFRMIHVPALRTTEDKGNHRMFCKAVQRVWDDRHMYDTLRALYGGETAEAPKPFPPPLSHSMPLERPTQPCVDIDVEYLQGVISFNAFRLDDDGGQALYAAPSLMNHSCIPSAHAEFIGDAYMVRARRDMKKGEEVTIAYIEKQASFDEKRYRLMSTWRFNCECGVCKADDEDGYDAREIRRTLSKKMDDIGEQSSVVCDEASFRRLATEAKKFCDNMKRTYHEEHGKKTGGLKYELVQPLRYYGTVLRHLGVVTNDQSYTKQVIEVKMQELIASGLKITDMSVSGALHKGKNTIPVDTSQVPQFYEFGVIAALEIAQHFRELSDNKRVKRWLNVAVWMENIYSGGGLPVFKFREATALAIVGLSDLL
ncbi:hypothetical protein SCHPADRAFT_1001647 [Schizopora paradoxa]|uniref:SET domain-containing protein n=1 Tax=Schizopora paradoxa TaxID=27342 RepID=A0A0H2RDA0_9AGAM|nr:hypothetical protein SCHPADRAFT_1001647 [Schizopora paradoxa]